MNKYLLIFILLFLGNNIFSQSQEIFRSDVETDKKPWTNLDFYNDPDNFQFAIVTDRTGGNRPGFFKDAVKKINTLYPEFVLTVGDMIEGYSRDTIDLENQWNEMNQTIESLKMPFFYLPGNHDITNKVMAKDWEERYGRRYYYFEYKNTLFIILDINDDEDYAIGREQTDFVLETLKENTDVRWTFILAHQPIWTYNTVGRFGEIEDALSDRDYSVMAGHVHNYNHEKRKGQNYYTLGTTGGSSRLRGNYFGEFDHITWVTMTSEGPSMTNLKLDGILAHDIANKETKMLSGVLSGNTSFKHLILCNEGDEFTDGTLYLNFENSGDKPINIDLQFYYHNQLKISIPQTNITLLAKTKSTIEIPFSSSIPLTFSELEPFEIDWKMGYDLPEYPGFQLEGKRNILVTPSRTSFMSPQIPKFLNNLFVSVEHPYANLQIVFEKNNKRLSDSDLIGKNKIEIEESGVVSIKLMNNKGQTTYLETRNFEKITKLKKAVKLRDSKPGLKYNYYEGDWDKVPDFDLLEVKSTGVNEDFWVSDYALREDHFGYVFTGFIKVEEDGLYVFNTRFNDAGRLFIHDEMVVNQDFIKENYNDVGAIALKKGFHPVSIHFVEKTGRERLRIYFKKTYDKDWEELQVNGRFYH